MERKDLAEGQALDRRTCPVYGLEIRLRRPGVEPTNNRGERALREGVVVRKIVGTLRNARGADVFSRLLTVLGSWRARGENPADRLYAALT